MYAVIETGGKQYKVAVGDKLKVEKLPVAEGESLSLERVLMIAEDDQVMVGSPLLENLVTATVLAHGRDRKIKVFKMKRRKNYRRTQGHRQAFTKIEITRIDGLFAATANPENEATAIQETEPQGSTTNGDKSIS